MDTCFGPGTIHYLSDGRAPPYYKVHMSIYAIFVVGKEYHKHAVRSYRGCFENTNGGQPDNGLSGCEGFYSRLWGERASECTL
jgi:hypothetical protein